MVLTSDGDSGDSKIIVKSVEGEEDLVDVTMKDATKASKSTKAYAPRSTPSPPPFSLQHALLTLISSPATTILKRFNQRRPKWVNTDQFLQSVVQNLFEMSYFSDGRNSDGIMATGWNVVDDNKEFPRLSTRMPEPETPVDDETQSTADWPNGNASDNESGSEESSPGVPAQTRMAEESSEDDVTVSYRVCFK